jgi:6,7-dimethyl-8-ribityllumazine synthase
LRASKSASGCVQLPPSVAAGTRVAVIAAEYHREITRSLERKCVEGLIKGGIRKKHIRVFAVPGCLEIPIFAERLARQRRYDALIALGAVIRGETCHFELVARECARGIMEVMLHHNVPIIFEVLATYNRRDALRRAGNNSLNKGAEAARTALSLLASLGEIKD